MCNDPFLMVSDVGLTFGAATLANANQASGVNLKRWRETPVWKDGPGCVGNFEKSFTGTLDEPVISEAGRRFLADLLDSSSRTSSSTISSTWRASRCACANPAVPSRGSRRSTNG